MSMAFSWKDGSVVHRGNIEMALRVECKRRFHSTNEKQVLKKC